MIIGIGIDIIEINRIAHAIQERPRFVDKILSEREKAIFQRLTSESRKAEWLAGRFAAKEAYAKARGTGIGSEVTFRGIQILNNTLGTPEIHTSTEDKIHLSISHSASYAVAQVIIES